MDSLRYGSSPLTRGKPQRIAKITERGRLIPAHAGKTTPAGACHMTPPAHPRSRGENFRMGGGGLFRSGSSPLTRGKPAAPTNVAELVRLIPAHAGKTPCSRAPSASPPAHPRSRGENGRGELSHVTSPGSSPLTRGKQVNFDSLSIGEGLIPAHAGKTPSYRLACGRGAAHPRSRGENENVWCVSLPHLGSSPLTRGKRAPPGRHRVPGGLIPAHAGKTSWRGQMVRPGPAHPRSRGENVPSVNHPVNRWGSSPLTRGKLVGWQLVGRGPGLIPAHAGKTSTPVPTCRPSRAHPRSRGENSS